MESAEPTVGKHPYTDREKECNRLYNLSVRHPHVVLNGQVIEGSHDDPPHNGWKMRCRLCCRLKQAVEEFTGIRSEWTDAEKR